MNEKIEKAKTFVKEHKKEILIGVGLTVIGGVTFAVTRKKPKIEDYLDKLPNIPKVKVKKLELSETLLQKGITEVSSPNPDEWFDIWADRIPLSELGNIGKELCETYDWKPEQAVGGVISIGMND